MGIGICTQLSIICNFTSGLAITIKYEATFYTIGVILNNLSETC